MKKAITYILLLILNSCNGQTKQEIKKSVENKAINKNNQINFLDTKYQTNGYSILDNLNGDLYPSYSYSDNNIGIFSVNYIGKNNRTQYFWNVHNPSGYFSKYKSPEDKEAQDSKNIKNAFDENNYYVIADVLSSKYITNLDKQSEEFDLKKNAKTDIYLYEENKWIKLGEFETRKIPERNFKFYIKLIQNHKKNVIPKQFQGNFSVSVDTEETTTGTSISYYFNISENVINLTENTSHEPINCDGTYIGRVKDNLLDLFYAGDDMDCILIKPRFNIKIEKGKYFIKGIGGEGRINSWIELNKK